MPVLTTVRAFFPLQLPLDDLIYAMPLSWRLMVYLSVTAVTTFEIIQLCFKNVKIMFIVFIKVARSMIYFRDWSCE